MTREQQLEAALRELLANAPILADDYLALFNDWSDDATIQGWEKRQWVRAAAAANAARALLAAAPADKEGSV